jgi:hypothetical protein
MCTVGTQRPPWALQVVELVREDRLPPLLGAAVDDGRDLRRPPARRNVSSTQVVAGEWTEVSKQSALAQSTAMAGRAGDRS